MQAVSDQNLPAELFPNYCTLEYTIQSQMQPSPPAYIFVVDTCLAEDELAACRAALSQALQLIPEYAQVTFFWLMHQPKAGPVPCMLPAASCFVVHIFGDPGNTSLACVCLPFKMLPLQRAA